MIVKIKGIHKVKMTLADGSKETYYYAWRGGPRMKSAPHTEAFAREHARLKDKAAEISKVMPTLDTLIEYFTGPEAELNPDFLALAESTRVDHQYAHKLILKEWPGLPLSFTQAKGFKGDIRKWHRSMRANPRKADKALFSLSKVFSYAIENEYDGIDKNPCTGINRLYKGSRKDFLWTAEQIAILREKLEAHLLLPFEIALATGQRQGDILSMTWKQWDGIYLMFKQSKTGKQLKVKANPRLKALLDPLAVTNRDKIRVCLNSRSRPWTKDGFKTSWGKAMASEEINIKGVTYHDLRGTFICDRAREGSSIEDIARISGHSMAEIKSVLEKHYLATDQGLSDAVIDRMQKNP
ncbi:integrase [Mesorhizobium sp. LSJC255A00]|uniref:tyrosine-type recombinase/integrase n=1 Tax=Mesorhizobium sp. LSJC255A00 TaxID=1287313 RepID=UPI0003CE79EE|nr:tyrosine-type recombinase/integrase [Mesorhizobium sp. LSJC255A00]ESX17546.1 integrase [Mesorhizobium sp. LSJC255A00]